MKKIAINVINFFKESKRTLIELVLAFSLWVTFLTRFVELFEKAYPVQGYLTIGMNPLPKYLRFLTSINDLLNNKPPIFIILVLTTIVFIYEFIAILNKIFKKKIASK